MRTIVLTALLVALVTVAVPADEEKDPNLREVYSGAGMLYSVPEITVVYPAGPGEDRERNRISAERRAAFLRGRYDSDARVVADVDVTDEHRDDNLLLLGWSNRLLAETELVELNDAGWNFLGLENGLDRDLLFAWISPFDHARLLVFWSRIDPELDRYLVLPFFGSDYVVFERYYVEQYGRFDREGDDWPPQRKPDVMVDNRTRRLHPKPSLASDHYVLHDAVGLTGEEASRVLEAREQAWQAATRVLGSPKEPRKIDLWVYGDSEHKEELSFVHDARHHMAEDGELHLTKVIALDPSAHEDSHLVARQLWGPGYLTVMVEGVAVMTEQDQGGNELPVYANMLTERGVTPSVTELLDEESMRVLTRERVGFTYSGLFVSWIRESFGLETVGRAYGVYGSEPGELASVLGIPAGELDDAFRAYVNRQAEIGAPEAAFRAAAGEGRHYSQLGDYERAIPAFERALEIRPDHHATRYRVARLQVELELHDDAEMNFRRVLKAPEEQRDTALTALTWFQLGELHAARGEMGKARKAFESVLELPDHREIHARAREALERVR